MKFSNIVKIEDVLIYEVEDLNIMDNNISNNLEIIKQKNFKNSKKNKHILNQDSSITEKYIISNKKNFRICNFCDMLITKIDNLTTFRTWEEFLLRTKHLMDNFNLDSLNLNFEKNKEDFYKIFNVYNFSENFKLQKSKSVCRFCISSFLGKENGFLNLKELICNNLPVPERQNKNILNININNQIILNIPDNSNKENKSLINNPVIITNKNLNQLDNNSFNDLSNNSKENTIKSEKNEEINLTLINNNNNNSFNLQENNFIRNNFNFERDKENKLKEVLDHVKSQILQLEEISKNHTLIINNIFQEVSSYLQENSSKIVKFENDYRNCVELLKIALFNKLINLNSEDIHNIDIVSKVSTVHSYLINLLKHNLSELQGHHSLIIASSCQKNLVDGNIYANYGTIFATALIKLKATINMAFENYCRTGDNLSNNLNQN